MPDGDARAWWFIESDDSDGPAESVGGPDLTLAHLALRARVRAQPKITEAWWTTQLPQLSASERRVAVIRYRARLAFTVAGAYRGRGLDMDDLVGVGLLALVERVCATRDLTWFANELWVSRILRVALGAAVAELATPIEYLGVTPTDLCGVDLFSSALLS